MTVWPWDKYKSAARRDKGRELLAPGNYIGELIFVGDVKQAVYSSTWHIRLEFQVGEVKMYYHLSGYVNTLHFILSHKDLFIGSLYKLKIAHVTHNKVTFENVRSIERIN